MPITLNYDIVIYGGTFAGVAAAWKAANYIKANGGGKKIAVIIPDVSEMLGGTGTAGAQNFIDIKPNSGVDDGKYHGGTFGYIYKDNHLSEYGIGNKRQNYSVSDMSRFLKDIINQQNENLADEIIDVFPNVLDPTLPSGYGYDIVDITKDISSGVIQSIRVKAMKRDTDGIIRYDNNPWITSEYIFTGDIFIDASEDGKLTSVSGVGPSIGRQDWPEEFLPEEDERCSETSSRQQAATLMFKAVVTSSNPSSFLKKARTMVSIRKSFIFAYNDEKDSVTECNPENEFFSLKPWNAARDGKTTEDDNTQTNEWWFNALLVYNVDGRAHERDRGTAMFPTDMRDDYLTTDQAWVMAREYIKNNKSAIESALRNSMEPSYSINSVSICTDGNNNPIVGDILYIRETVHTTISPSNNAHGSEDSNYAVSPIESILAGDPNGNYASGVPGQDSGNINTRIGLAFYQSDINAYEKSDLKDSDGNHIWGPEITKKLRPDLETLIRRITHDDQTNNVNPKCAVFMPFEALTCARVPNLLTPGVSCGVSSISWSEVRVLPNLFVLGDAAGVAAGYSVMHNNLLPGSFSQQNIAAVQSFLTGNSIEEHKAILDKPE